MDLKEAIDSKKQIPHKYAFFHPRLGNYALEYKNKYYTPKTGLRTFEQAKVYSKIFRIYKYEDGELLYYNPQLPSDIYTSEIAKYLDHKTLANMTKSSKTINKYLIQEYRNRVMKNHRDKITYNLRLLLSERLPEPRFKYGITDYDTIGNPIRENIESNDQWEKLIYLLNYASEKIMKDPENVIKIKPYIKQLIDKDLIYGTNSFKKLIEHIDDPVDLMRGKRDYIKSLIYETHKQTINKHFSETGEFASTVDYNKITRPMLLKIKYNLLELFYPTGSRIHDKEMYEKDLKNYLETGDLATILDSGSFAFNRLSDENIMLIKERVIKEDSYDLDVMYVKAMMSRIYNIDQTKYLDTFEYYIRIVSEEYLEQNYTPDAMINVANNDELREYYISHGINEDYMNLCDYQSYVNEMIAAYEYEDDYDYD